MTHPLKAACLGSPIGPLLVLVREERLHALRFSDDQLELFPATRRPDADAEIVWTEDPGGVVTRLRAYLAGDVRAIEEIEVDPDGTPFQLRVWQALRRIPAGTTLCYSELARRLGDPLATRAVASANAKNPIAIVIPCHRVIAKNGELWGYGGGLWRKRWLLAHEGVPELHEERVEPVGEHPAECPSAQLTLPSLG